MCFLSVRYGKSRLWKWLRTTCGARSKCEQNIKSFCLVFAALPWSSCNQTWDKEAFLLPFCCLYHYLKIVFIMKDVKYVQKWRKWHTEPPHAHYPVSTITAHGQSCFIYTPAHSFPLAPQCVILKQIQDSISFQMHIFWVVFLKDKVP